MARKKGRKREVKFHLMGVDRVMNIDKFNAIFRFDTSRFQQYQQITLCIIMSSYGVASHLKPKTTYLADPNTQGH